MMLSIGPIPDGETMTAQRNTPSNELIDAFIRKSLDGVKIPRKYKKKKNSDFPPMPDIAILQIAFSTGKDGFSTRVSVGSDAFHMSMTRYLLRVWVDGNWNTDTPSLEGDAVLMFLRRGIEEIRVKLAASEAESVDEESLIPHPCD
jgi:hypothetical protein